MADTPTTPVVSAPTPAPVPPEHVIRFTIPIPDFSKAGKWVLVVVKGASASTIYVGQVGLGVYMSFLIITWLLGHAPHPFPPGPIPTPIPTPGPAPIAEPGNRVLIVYDDKTYGDLPFAQREAIAQVTAAGNPLHAYLMAKCAKEADGKQPAFRAYPSSTDLSNESKTWQDAFQRPRKSMPWIIISTGTSGTEQPLPANADETLKLLQKYFGS